LFAAKPGLERSVAGQEFSYREALENAIRFNKNEDRKDGYYRLKGELDDGRTYSGLMAIPVKQANGKYSLQIVERTYANEALFANHV